MESYLFILRSLCFAFVVAIRKFVIVGDCTQTHLRSFLSERGGRDVEWWSGGVDEFVRVRRCGSFFWSAETVSCSFLRIVVPSSSTSPSDPYCPISDPMSVRNALDRRITTSSMGIFIFFQIHQIQYKSIIRTIIVFPCTPVDVTLVLQILGQGTGGHTGSVLQEPRGAGTTGRRIISAHNNNKPSSAHPIDRRGQLFPPSDNCKNPFFLVPLPTTRWTPPSLRISPIVEDYDPHCRSEDRPPRCILEQRIRPAAWSTLLRHVEGWIQYEYRVPPSRFASALELHRNGHTSSRQARGHGAARQARRPPRGEQWARLPKFWECWVPCERGRRRRHRQ